MVMLAPLMIDWWIDFWYLCKAPDSI